MQTVSWRLAPVAEAATVEPAATLPQAAGHG
jgi:hypothetical protein